MDFSDRSLWGRRTRLASLVVAAVAACLAIALRPDALAVGSVTASSAFDLKHGPDRVTDGVTLDSELPDAWWLPDGESGWIQLDFARDSRIDEVSILNTKGGRLGGRGARAFELVQLGPRGSEVLIEKGDLPEYPGWRVVRLEGRQRESALGIRVRIVDFTGKGGGLNEIRVGGVATGGAGPIGERLGIAVGAAIAAYLLVLFSAGWIGAPRPRYVTRLDSLFLGLGPGLLFFVLLVGVEKLDPHNVDWLFTGYSKDPATQFLGWHFFRREAWSFPPGLIGQYCWPEGTSIGYTDTIPLLALALKPFHAWLPDPFQFSGLWLLSCFLLQGLLGFLLMRSFTLHAGHQVVGSLLFLTSPMMLMRVNLHPTLAAHWVVLAGLLLCVLRREELQSRRWTLLIVLSAFIHQYLWAMSMALWFADASRVILWSRTRVARSALIVTSAMVAMTLLAQWSSGLFSIGFGNAVATGIPDLYSCLSMNLNAVINPVTSAWSTFTKVRPLLTEQQYEGFCYPGAGVWLLWISAAILMLSRRDLQGRRALGPWLPLAGVCLGLVSYAVGNVIAFDRRVVLEYHAPAFLKVFHGLFRAGGRFVWPAVYFVSYAALRCMVRSLSPTAAFALLAIALAVQIVDVREGLSQLRTGAMSRPAFLPLDSDRWQRAARTYKAVAVVPRRDIARYEVLAHYAASHGLSLNVGNFARVDYVRYRSIGEEMLARVERGAIDGDTMYVIDDEALFKRLEARKQVGQTTDVLDGFRLLFPRGNPE